MTAHEDLVAWADYCAKLARDTPGPQFSEPLLTEIRLGWDRVIAAFQREEAVAHIGAIVDQMKEHNVPPYATDERAAITWPKSWRSVAQELKKSKGHL